MVGESVSSLCVLSDGGIGDKLIKMARSVSNIEMMGVCKESAVDKGFAAGCCLNVYLNQGDSHLLRMSVQRLRRNIM